MKCEKKPHCKDVIKEDPYDLVEIYDYKEQEEEVCDVTCTEYTMSKCPDHKANVLKKRTFTKTFRS